MAGDDAIDGDVFGYDDDGGRGALNWDTCKGLTVRLHAPLFLPNSFLICQNIYFSILDPLLSGYCVRLSAIDL